MGHTCEILTFTKGESQQMIINKCNQWGSANCDPQERGGYRGGLHGKIQFLDRKFDSLDQAEDFLNKTFGNYNLYAVQYVINSPKPSKKLEDLYDKWQTATKKYTQLRDKPHFLGVKQKTIKCRICGSSFNTEYSGKTLWNNCLICGIDLRPASTLSKLEIYKENARAAKAKYEAQKKLEESKKVDPKYGWAVACEAHY